MPTTKALDPPRHSATEDRDGWKSTVKPKPRHSTDLSSTVFERSSARAAQYTRVPRLRSTQVPSRADKRQDSANVLIHVCSLQNRPITNSPNGSEIDASSRLREIRERIDPLLTVIRSQFGQLHVRIPLTEFFDMITVGRIRRWSPMNLHPLQIQICNPVATFAYTGLDRFNVSTSIQR